MSRLPVPMGGVPYGTPMSPDEFRRKRLWEQMTQRQTPVPVIESATGAPTAPWSPGMSFPATYISQDTMWRNPQYAPIPKTNVGVLPSTVARAGPAGVCRGVRIPVQGRRGAYVPTQTPPTPFPGAYGDFNRAIPIESALGSGLTPASAPTVIGPGGPRLGQRIPLPGGLAQPLTTGSPYAERAIPNTDAMNSVPSRIDQTLNPLASGIAGQGIGVRGDVSPDRFEKQALRDRLQAQYEGTQDAMTSQPVAFGGLRDVQPSGRISPDSPLTRLATKTADRRYYMAPSPAAAPPMASQAVPNDRGESYRRIAGVGKDNTNYQAATSWGKQASPEARRHLDMVGKRRAAEAKRVANRRADFVARSCGKE